MNEKTPRHDDWTRQPYEVALEDWADPDEYGHEKTESRGIFGVGDTGHSWVLTHLPTGAEVASLLHTEYFPGRSYLKLLADMLVEADALPDSEKVTGEEKEVAGEIVAEWRDVVRDEEGNAGAVAVKACLLRKKAKEIGNE